MPQDLFAAYLSGAAADFFAHHFADPVARRRAVQVATRPLAPAVATALDAQNARLEPSAARDAHLAALRRGAAAVVTGQQVGLFLGPLFTIYKAASAIQVARALSEEVGQPVVPVFWLQTEDHDLAEVATCCVAGAHGTVALSLPAADSQRIPIAHQRFDGQILGCCAQLEATVGHLPHAAAHLALMRRHYRPDAGWAAAFAGALAELFAPDGLVVIDPRDSALAPAAAPVHRLALENARPIADALTARRAQLTAAGFAPAVHVRQGSPLSFFHPQGTGGPRYRLEAKAGGYLEVGGTTVHTREELLAALAADPLRFSTSALLRPILQDSLLPTAAYVGGPGEIAYFAQLAPLYAAYRMTMPLIVPRARFRIVEPRARRLLDQLRLVPADAHRPEDELLAIIHGSGEHLTGTALADRLLAPFQNALEHTRAQIEAGGPGLDRAIEKTRTSVEKAVAKLTAKYERARLHRAQDVVAALRELKRRLYPDGLPQERVYGMSSFAARWGDRTFVERVVAAIIPFHPDVQDLEWPEPAQAVETAL